jgi:hypothetical protein
LNREKIYSDGRSIITSYETGNIDSIYDRQRKTETFFENDVKTLEVRHFENGDFEEIDYNPDGTKKARRFYKVSKWEECLFSL